MIAAYNAETDIIRGIDTVLAQAFADLEIVVVNDGSTDHTAEILDWYAHNYPNITVIHQENADVQAARNAGILRAKGEYIGFVDSDDMIRPDMVEELYTSAIKNQCDIAMKWAGKSKEEVFQDHKRAILFYLEHGNPERQGLLKELTKNELNSFAKAMQYARYQELRKQIEGEETK